MKTLPLLLLAALGSACAPVDSAPDGVTATPTVAEGVAWTCRRASALPCDEPPPCTLPQDALANVEARRCDALWGDHFRCMMRPQWHACALLASYTSAACARIFEAANACTSPTNPTAAPGAYAPAPAGIAQLPSAASLLLESDLEGSSALYPVDVTMTVSGAAQDRLRLRLVGADPARLSMACDVALTYDGERRYHLDASASPECFARVAGAEHRLQFTGAAAFQLEYEDRPRVWLETTATGPALSYAASATLIFAREGEGG
ncbi:MAG: hypothetical protein R3A52_27075 [Polyangiales bacterium]